MLADFQRDYLVRLPLPLAQLYRRANNAKDARSRHDNIFYLFESLVKLSVAPSAAFYLLELERGSAHVEAVDRQLVNLALPSLGQWVGMLRELAKHFGGLPDAASHPLGHLWQQLTRSHKDMPAILGLYNRIKNGPDSQPATDSTVSLLQLFDGLVQYRNGVFGHGAGRFESFYEKEMGPLLFPAVNEILAEGAFDFLGPRGARLVQLSDVKTLSDGRVEVSMRELVGPNANAIAPLQLDPADAEHLAPNHVALWWPGRKTPVRLDPLLVFRESDTTEDVLFLNRDRNGRQVEYLSYATGRTERDKQTVPRLAELLSRITGRDIEQTDIEALAERSLTETSSAESLLGAVAPPKRSIGDYEIIAEIGRGGMGVVYLARQLTLGRMVALKMLPADLAGDETALLRFNREIKALGRCDHPNIVKVLSSGAMPDGQLYYTMEYVPGADLEQVWRELSGSHRHGDTSSLGNSTFVKAVHSATIKQRQHAETRFRATSEGSSHDASAAGGREGGAALGNDSKTGALPLLPMPPVPELPNAVDDPGGYVKRVAKLLRDVADALQTVHEQGIVHRDVKPANLMLTPDGSRIVLMDFGLAKGQSMALSASQHGGLLGTMRYAAPEQLAAASIKVGPAADVRGLGVVLWELLTRRRLFEDAEDEKQLAMKVHESDVPRLRSIDPSLDRDMEAIVARATERRLGDRIATAEKLAEYLDLYLAGEPLPIRPPGKMEMARRWLRSHRAIAGSIFMVLFLAAAAAGYGWWRWDSYSRPYVRYYSTLTKRNAVVEGVGELSEDQVHHRAISLRFTYDGRRGPVKMIEAIDGNGNPGRYNGVGTYLDTSENTGPKPCKWEFKRNESGAVAKELAIDRNGRTLYELQYTNGIGRASYVVDGYVRSRSGSGAAYVDFIRADSGPAAGCETEIHYSDVAGNPQPDARGVWGERYWLNDSGLAVKSMFLDKAGRPMMGRDGYAGFTRTLNERGEALRAQLIDADGKPVRGRDGYTTIEWKYDNAGNQVSESYLDEQDKATISRQGYARYDSHYDEHGNLTDVLYFDDKGNPARTPEGYAKYTTAFDSNGNSTDYAYFDEQGAPYTLADGYSRIHEKFDAAGNVVEWDYLDESGKPARHRRGYAKITAVYDARGNIVDQSYLDARGALVTETAGYARLAQVFDPRGRVTSQSYFDVKGAPARSSDGYSRYVNSIDARGNITQIDYYDERGARTSCAAGYATVRRSYNDMGSLAEESYLDEMGAAVFHDGYAIQRQEADSLGNILKISYFDAQRKPIRCNDGYASLQQAFDSASRVTEVDYFDEAGKPVRGEKGYARFMQSFDDRGNILEQRFFDEQAKPTRNNRGIAVVRWEYDRFGNRVRTDCLDPDGKLTLNSEGVARYRDAYDRWGRLTESRFFDAADKPAPGNSHYAAYAQTWDSRGNLTHIAYLDEHGRPKRVSEGYASRDDMYDDSGNLAERRFYDEQGKLARNAEGIARVTGKFDEHGNGIEIRYFGPDGAPTTHKEGNAGVLRKFDDRGKILESLFVDVANNPVRLTTGQAKMKFTYDARGRTTGSSTYDEQGAPTLDNDGSARTARVYDDRGNVVREDYFDAADKPALCQAGYASIVKTYDQRGKLRTVRYLDEKGQPCVNSNGSAGTNTDFDERGYVKEEVTIDEKGRPAAVYQGVAARRAHVCDARGNILEERFYDALNLPVAPENSAPELIRTYGGRGELRSITFLDGYGKPYRTALGYQRLEQQADDRGNIIQVAYFDAADKPARLNGNQYASFRIIYNDAETREEEIFFDALGKRAPHPEGFYKRTETRDVMGRPLEVTIYDEKDQPLKLAAGYCSWRNTYDERGNLALEEYFDENGKPVVNTNAGYARRASTFDARGNMVEQTTFNAMGQPAAGDTLYATIRQKFDNRDNMVEIQYLDAAGKPVKSKDGYAGMKQSFDDRRRMVGRTLVDEQGRPTLIDGGKYAMWKKKMDARGNELEEQWLDASGNPAPNFDGGAKRIRVCDTRGQVLNESWFDAKDQPCLVDGVFQTQREFDGPYLLRESYYGVDSQPVLKGRIASMRYKRRASGALDELAYFGLDDEPAMGPDGYHKMVFRREEGTDRVLSVERQDTQGEDVVVTPQFVVVTEILASGQAQAAGLHVGDVILRYDGVSIFRLDQLRELMKKPADNPEHKLVVSRGTATLDINVKAGPLGVGLDEMPRDE